MTGQNQRMLTHLPGYIPERHLCLASYAAECDLGNISLLQSTPQVHSSKFKNTSSQTRVVRGSRALNEAARGTCIAKSPQLLKVWCSRAVFQALELMRRRAVCGSLVTSESVAVHSLATSTPIQLQCHQQLKVSLVKTAQLECYPCTALL